MSAINKVQINKYFVTKQMNGVMLGGLIPESDCVLVNRSLKFVLTFTVFWFGNYYIFEPFAKILEECFV